MYLFGNSEGKSDGKSCSPSVLWPGAPNSGPLECKSHSNTFCEFFLARIIGSAFLCKVQWGSLAYLKRMGPVLLRQLLFVTFLIKPLLSDEESCPFCTWQTFVLIWPCLIFPVLLSPSPLSIPISICYSEDHSGWHLPWMCLLIKIFQC